MSVASYGTWGRRFAVVCGAWLATVAPATLAAPAAPGPSAAPAAAPAPPGPLPSLLRVEFPREFGHHIGDVLVYRALLAWPPDWALDRDGLPAATRDDPPVELVGHAVEAAGDTCGDCRWLVLRWQVFKGVRAPEDLALPATPVRLRRDAQLVTLQLPGTVVALSPLVPWQARRNWLDTVRPGWVAAPFDVDARLAEMAAALALALAAALAWAWASGRWLPRRGSRPFAQAWRAVRARRRSGPLDAADEQDLQHWHQAFNATLGQAVFLDGLDAFFAARPVFAALQAQARHVFESSREAFFLAPPPHRHGRIAAQDLERLLRRFADVE